MKMKSFGWVLAATLAVTGCVSTVSNQKTAGVPLVNDQISGRYERPVGQVYEAAKQVLAFNGVIDQETSITATNSVRALEGTVNKRKVWIRVEQVDAKTTAVTVQARTKMGGTDIELVHELDKEIALKLAQH